MHEKQDNHNRQPPQEYRDFVKITDELSILFDEIISKAEVAVVKTLEKRFLIAGKNLSENHSLSEKTIPALMIATGIASAYLHRAVRVLQEHHSLPDSQAEALESSLRAVISRAFSKGPPPTSSATSSATGSWNPN